MAAKRAAKTLTRKPAKASEVEDDEEDEDDEPEKVLATYDPESHVCVPAETFHLLIQAKEEVDKRAIALIEADAQRAQTLFTGFQVGAGIQQDQLKGAYEYGNNQREEAERYRRRVSEIEMDMAKMVRQSEDAKLERDRLAAELKRGEQALERLEMELKLKNDLRKAELDAVQRAAAPVFAVAAQGIAGLMAQHIHMPALPAKPNETSASGQVNGHAPPVSNAPVVTVSADDTDTWKAVFLDVFNGLGPKSLACLRAITSSATVPGAPPVPALVRENLIGFVMQDVGEQKVMALLHASAAAYSEAPSPSVAPVTNGAPPN
jgi:hypothetical protein